MMSKTTAEVDTEIETKLKTKITKKLSYITDFLFKWSCVTKNVLIKYAQITIQTQTENSSLIINKIKFDHLIELRFTKFISTRHQKIRSENLMATAMKKKPASKKAATKKTAAKPAAKKFATKKVAAKKPAAKKVATKKVAAKKPAAKKVATKKVAAKKPASKKVASKKVATKKPAAKKVATKKVAAKKPAAKKVATKSATKPAVTPLLTATHSIITAPGQAGFSSENSPAIPQININYDVTSGNTTSTFVTGKLSPHASPRKDFLTQTRTISQYTGVSIDEGEQTTSANSTPCFSPRVSPRKDSPRYPYLDRTLQPINHNYTSSWQKIRENTKDNELTEFIASTTSLYVEDKKLDELGIIFTHVFYAMISGTFIFCTKSELNLLPKTDLFNQYIKSFSDATNSLDVAYPFLHAINKIRTGLLYFFKNSNLVDDLAQESKIIEPLLKLIHQIPAIQNPIDSNDKAKQNKCDEYKDILAMLFNQVYGLLKSDHDIQNIHEINSAKQNIEFLAKFFYG
ncbi:hypothetical protein ACTFIZ_002268 [Dictyostelium cf. discoideum]